jgi:hypothetical protein
MISIEMERENKLTIRQWEEFLLMARRAGAGDDTPVEEVTVPQEEDILTGWRVKAAVPAVADLDCPVSLPAWLVQDLLRVVTVVAESDGDVSGLETGAQTALEHAHAHLLRPVLGQSVYSGDSKDEPDPA